MMDIKLPLVSIIIPVKPGGYVKALDSVKLLDYPQDRMEVFIAEGCQPSKQRNEAAKEAIGEILYFLDDDSCPHIYNLRRLAGHFARSEVAVVGGPSITPDMDSFLQHCFSAVFSSPFGGAGVRNRYMRTGTARETSEKELILCNLAVRATVYMEMGGLNERLYPNEENELMVRIASSEKILIHDPDIYVYRSQRESIAKFARQILSYGRGRFEQTMLNPRSFSISHFVPMVFLFYCLLTPFFYSPLYLFPLSSYIVLAIFFSSRGCFGNSQFVKSKFKSFLLIFFLFPLMHLAYGAGLLGGMKRILFKSQIKEVDIHVSRVD